MKRFFVIISFGVLLWIISSSNVSAETIYLKDGTTVIDTIISQDDRNLMVETDEYEKKPFEKDQKERVKKEEASNERILKEIELNRLKSRKQLDLIGLLTVYGLTIVGDIALGGEFFIGSAIPVIGPFINIGLINEEDYWDPDDANRDRVLCLIAGGIQTAFFIDYLITSKKEGNLQKKFGFRIQPMYKDVGLVFSFNF